jgi:hypothetical protein
MKLLKQNNMKRKTYNKKTVNSIQAGKDNKLLVVSLDDLPMDVEIIETGKKYTLQKTKSFKVMLQ